MAVRARRALVAGIAALAIAVPVATNVAADANTDKDSHHAEASHGQGQGQDKDREDKAGKDKADNDRAEKDTSAPAKQLLKRVSVMDAKLARLATSKRTTRLADDVEAALLANMTADRAGLAVLRSEYESSDSGLDADAERDELREFRVVNYVHAGNILRQAGKAEEKLTDEATASARLEKAVAAALEITAASTKSQVRAARELVRVAIGEDETDDADEQDDPED